MKHLKLFACAIFAGQIIFAVTSCTKNYSEPAPSISSLSFINASPDGPSVTLYMDQNQVNNDLFGYTDHIDYLNVYSGNRNVYAYEGSDKKVSGSITLGPQKIYSLFLAGRWASAEFVLLEDSLAKPDAGKAAIRFINMSVDAPSLDLGLNDGSTLISGRTYKQNSGFTAIDGDKKYTFVIREHGATANKVTLSEVTLDAGHIYTVWANGIYTDTGTNGSGGAIIKNY